MEDTVTETTVDESVKSTPAPAEEKEVSTKETPEPTTEKTPEAVKEEYFDDIESLEDDERGKYSLKVGESTYYGQTKKEVIQNLIKGKEESDAFIRKTKIAEKVKVPERQKEVEVPKIELPDEREIYNKNLTATIKRYGVEPAMLRFGRDDWNKYQDDNGLRDHEISDLKRDVREILKETTELTRSDMYVANKAYINSYTIEKETPAVREMLAESKIDQDKFDYESVLENVMKKVGKDGVIEPGMITSEAYKQIMRISKQNSVVKKDLSAIIEKGRETKSSIKSPTNGDKIKKEDNRFLSYDQIGREEKRVLEKIGREI